MASSSVYVIAEIGINHNGDLAIAKELISAAKKAGCDAVKFQKRTPDICTPEKEKKKRRETPWGNISYLEYRQKVEFGLKEYKEIDKYCKKVGIDWFASVWDEPSVDFIIQFAPIYIKIPSAMVTNTKLLRYFTKFKIPLILSTGMSTMKQIQRAVDILGMKNLIITHCTSSYPCDPKELNLKMIQTLAKKFKRPVGYSGHEVGIAHSIAAVSLGATLIERHITLDKTMWGSDQEASLEPQEFALLIKNIREVEISLGDGIKKVYQSELSAMQKLRKV